MKRGIEAKRSLNSISNFQIRAGLSKFKKNHAKSIEFHLVFYCFGKNLRAFSEFCPIP